MIATLGLLIGLMISTSAFAGASNATLDCKSASGVTLKGNVPGDFSEFDLNLQVGGKTGRLHSTQNEDLTVDENATVSVVEDLKNGVWTLVSERTKGDWGYIRIYALPKTVKYARNKFNTGSDASFSAKLSYGFPELPESRATLITVTCSWHYSI